MGNMKGLSILALYLSLVSLLLSHQTASAVWWLRREDELVSSVQYVSILFSSIIMQSIFKATEPKLSTLLN